jgi:hypothetical protein
MGWWKQEHPRARHGTSCKEVRTVASRLGCCGCCVQRNGFMPGVLCGYRPHL